MVRTHVDELMKDLTPGFVQVVYNLWFHEGLENYTGVFHG